MSQSFSSPVHQADLQRIVDTVLSAELPPIVHAGHPVLRTPALPFDGQFDDAVLHLLLETMRRVMHAAPGVGLAAPQIGIPLRIAVLEDKGVEDDYVAALRLRTPLPFFAIINPSYAAAGSETASFYEGCLSVPGYQAVVERHRDVDLSYTRPDGRPVTERFSGWPARIAQHETDHLDGTLYLDRALLRSLTDNSELARRWSQPGIDGARTALGF
ncbi:peptide deformylase [Arthrobacter sp. H41]|uniref:peptide deformylase n=1 Tax=Arthrobacter sp. H41 TaxID=1312978 RepID=UPI00047C3EDC|nr:peptide deformylase [Arthrobacter sp. H41]